MARAYDAIAGEYDRQVAGDEWMRKVLHARYACLFRPGQRILDVSCGTGTDALFLAGRGIRVVGVDVSPGMVGRLRARVSEVGLDNRVEAQVIDFAELAAWPPESFDGIVSAFAGLNTVPDLAPFAADAARLLRPRGRLVVHLLNRFSLWEWLGLVKEGRWSAATALGRQRERCFTIGGERVKHHLFSPVEAHRSFFAPYFALNAAYSLGCLRPPHTVRRVPMAVAEALGRLERTAGSHRPFVNWGRFFVLEMTCCPPLLQRPSR